MDSIHYGSAPTLLIDWEKTRANDGNIVWQEFHEPPWPYNPESRTIDFGALSVAHRGHSTNFKVLGYPVKIWDNYNAGELNMYTCSDDDGPTFHVAPSTYHIDLFHETLRAYQMALPIGWTPDERYRHDSTPLQEQVEKAETDLELVRDCLAKAIDVIEAMAAERQQAATDVYQAQLDAQDWQNKYNESQKTLVWTSQHGRWEADKEQIRELTNELHDARQQATQAVAMFESSQNRINVLAEQNTELGIEVESLNGRLDAYRSGSDDYFERMTKQADTIRKAQGAVRNLHYVLTGRPEPQPMN